ncbi:hypothetical protein [Rhizorhapis suberifaciens]|uniref:Uncharacterized protein n=1 Tax=Rhizorhapis suberifaciens TaxID=13656 RepID=A0A840HR42_9SPHN|nr:hypothetical protein [Rhizorhapis suberifaciens]MBB4640395.1 hypothetical protein [Rhizorhapis suberifaciens]
MFKKLLMAAAVTVLVPTGTALAHDGGRYGYSDYRGGHYYYNGDRRHSRLNSYDRALRELRYAYRHGYISRWEYRMQKRELERERRWARRDRDRWHYRDRRYGYRW